MENNNLQRYSLPRQVADRLEKLISDGVYKVGEKIPTESELMSEFNVSRNTVREAVKSLTSAGVLVVRQGDGTYVKSSDRFTANMIQKLEQVSVDEIQEARKALEISIVYLAAQRRTADDIIEIHEKLDARRTCDDSIKENTVADIEFHMAIARACHNDIIYDLYKSLYSYMESQIALRHLSTELNIRTIDELHEALFNAIAKQEPEEARSCAKKILDL